MARATCPTCGKKFEAELAMAMPFCCERCREIDLGRWLSEANTLPLPPRGAEDEDEA